MAIVSPGPWRVKAHLAFPPMINGDRHFPYQPPGPLFTLILFAAVVTRR
jgi:hypothetical protein